MKTLMIAATILSIAVGGSAMAKSAAGNDKMKACSAQWADMKKSGQAKGMKYKDFSKTCLAGASTTTTSTTTTAPVVKTAPAAKIAPLAKAAPATPAAAPMAPTPAATPSPMATTTTTHHVATSSSSSTTMPAGATAKCKDGTYSMSKTHSGSCSHHGGVANFL